MDTLRPALSSQRYSPIPDDYYDGHNKIPSGNDIRQSLHETASDAEQLQHHHNHQEQVIFQTYSPNQNYYDSNNHYHEVPGEVDGRQSLEESAGKTQYEAQQVASHRCVPISEYYRDDTRHDAHSSVNNARQPLQESTGNSQQLQDKSHSRQHDGDVQSHCLKLQQARFDRISSYNPWPNTILAPATVPTQALGASSSYRTNSGLRQRRQQITLMKQGSKHSLNPIYLSPEFKQYRARQLDKDAQIWTDVLEDAFLDALLIIPDMGRRKYMMKESQYGRNMVIMEYLYMAYCKSLPPGVDPDQKMRRGRKQVSSHIQVLKGFFKSHRCYHLFFGKGKKAIAGGRFRIAKDEVEIESFGTNPVLTALSQGHLPDERPNYEYFAQLLASDALVTIRPQMCWIYVSNTKIKDDAKDGTTYHETEGLLSEASFPHRYNFTSGREDWSTREKEEKSIKQTLLHEYTWSMKQMESSSVREITDEWKVLFPRLNAALDIALTDNQCDFIHMHVTLDIHRVLALPKESQLDGLIKVTIARPEHQSHTWRSVTRLQRPLELCDYDEEEKVCTVYNPIGQIFLHSRGCYDGNPGCECERHRSDVCRMPFPADKWAKALTACAEYPPYPVPRNNRRRQQQHQSRQHQQANRESKYDGSDSKDKYSVSKYDCKHLTSEPREIDPDMTQMDLVKGIAMYQELSSCPRGMEYEPKAWTRRAVMLWTFDTIYHFEKDKLLKQPAGTSWRFLTALDPYSATHQANILVSGNSSMPSVMSPSPAYQRLLGAQMNENSASAYDNVHFHMPDTGGGAVSLMPPSPLASYGPGSINTIEPFSNGLATTSLAAALSSSYASFDVVDVHSQGLGSQHHLSFMPTASASDNDNILVTGGGVQSSTDPYLPTGTHVSSLYEEPVDMDDSQNFHNFGTSSLSNMASLHWSTFKTASHAANSGIAAIDWSQPSDGLPQVTENGSSNSNSSDSHVPSTHLQLWNNANNTMAAVGTAIPVAEDHEVWTTVTAVSSPSCEDTSQGQWSQDDWVHIRQPQTQTHPTPHWNYDADLSSQMLTQPIARVSSLLSTAAAHASFTEHQSEAPMQPHHRHLPECPSSSTPRAPRLADEPEAHLE